MDREQRRLESPTSIGGDFPIASAKEGSRFLYQQGAVAKAVLKQTVELYNVPKNDLDTGSLTARQVHHYRVTRARSSPSSWTQTAWCYPKERSPRCSSPIT